MLIRYYRIGTEARLKGAPRLGFAMAHHPQPGVAVAHHPRQALLLFSAAAIIRRDGLEILIFSA